MKNLLLLIGLLFVVPLVSAAQVTHYSFNYTGEDLIGGVNLSLSGGADYVSFYPTFNASGDGGNGSLETFISTDYARNSVSNNLVEDSTFTYSFWINPQDTATSVFYEQGDFANSKRSLAIGFDGSDKIWFGFADTSDTQWACQWSTDNAQLLGVNQWNHVAFVSNDGDVYTYINGSSVAVTEDQGCTTGEEIRTSSTTRITMNNRGDGAQAFNGRIDEFKIFNTVLTTDEVQNLYNCNNETTCEDFNESTVKITAVNGFTSANVTNFNISWVDLNDSSTGSANSGIYHNASFTEETNNTITINWSKDGYAPMQTNITLTDLIEPYQFTVYTANSVLVNILDDEGTVITNNASVTFNNDTFEVENSTIVGSLLFENLADGNYTVTVESAGYTTGVYTVTVANQSTQTLTAYLSANTSQVIFLTQDFDSSEILEGASIQVERIINSSWEVVASKLTDITGRTQFDYVTGVKYRFTVSLTGYTTKQFELNPILFDDYTVRLEKIVTLEEDLDYTGLTVSFAPKKFAVNDTGSFNITFNSPIGALESYGYQISYSGGSSSGSGSNALGESFTTVYTITGAEFLDYFNVTYYYDTTLGDNRTFTYPYLISGTTTNQSHISIKETDYGLGDFEKGVLTTIVVIFIGGIGGLVAGSIAGFVLAVFTFGYFVYIGFISVWALIITFIVGFFIVVKRSQ